MNAKDLIVKIVKSDETPSIDQFVRADDENRSALSLLLTKITGQNILPFNGPNEVIFNNSAGRAVLVIRCDSNGEWHGEGERLTDVINMILAIRVHEVDSYDWVYLPPEMRRDLVAERAAKVQTSSEELHRLIKIWLT